MTLSFGLYDNLLDYLESALENYNKSKDNPSLIKHAVSQGFQFVELFCKWIIYEYIDEEKIFIDPLTRDKTVCFDDAFNIIIKYLKSRINPLHLKELRELKRQVILLKDLRNKLTHHECILEYDDASYYFERTMHISLLLEKLITKEMPGYLEILDDKKYEIFHEMIKDDDLHTEIAKFKAKVEQVVGHKRNYFGLPQELLIECPDCWTETMAFKEEHRTYKCYKCKREDETEKCNFCGNEFITDELTEWNEGLYYCLSCVREIESKD